MSHMKAYNAYSLWLNTQQTGLELPLATPQAAQLQRLLQQHPREPAEKKRKKQRPRKQQQTQMTTSVKCVASFS